MSTTQPCAIAIRRTGLVTSVGLNAACPARRSAPRSPTRARRASSTRTASGSWRTRCRSKSRGAGAPSSCAWQRWRRRNAWQAWRASGGMKFLCCCAWPSRSGRDAWKDWTTCCSRNCRTCWARASRAISLVVAHGRVGALVALAQAQRLIGQEGVPQVLVVAADSLLSWPTLGAYDRDHRLLTAENSNGFIPGEGAGALLLGLPGGGRPAVHRYRVRHREGAHRYGRATARRRLERGHRSGAGASRLRHARHRLPRHRSLGRAVLLQGGDACARAHAASARRASISGIRRSASAKRGPRRASRCWRWQMPHAAGGMRLGQSCWRTWRTIQGSGPAL